MKEFWIHLNATKPIVERLKRHVQPNTHIERLVNISSFLSIISDSTDMNLEPMPWPGSYKFYREGLVLTSDGDGLMFTYGITPELATCINAATMLSRHISYHLARSDVLPEDLTLEIENLLRRLESWSIESEILESLMECDDTTVHLGKLHIMAFAQSTRIYLCTRVLPFTPAQLSPHVREVANYLTEIEDLKARTGYDSVLTATIAWPGFIASCEAEPQDRDDWYHWWGSMVNYGIGNISALWKVVQEAWRLRDSGLRETPAWLPVLRNAKQRILAI